MGTAPSRWLPASPKSRRLDASRGNGAKLGVGADSRLTVSLLTPASEQSWVKLQSFSRYWVGWASRPPVPSPPSSRSCPAYGSTRSSVGGCHRSTDRAFASWLLDEAESLISNVEMASVFAGTQSTTSPLADARPSRAPAEIAAEPDGETAHPAGPWAGGRARVPAEGEPPSPVQVHAPLGRLLSRRLSQTGAVQPTGSDQHCSPEHPRA